MDNSADSFTTSSRANHRRPLSDQREATRDERLHASHKNIFAAAFICRANYFFSWGGKRTGNIWAICPYPPAIRGNQSPTAQKDTLYIFHGGHDMDVVGECKLCGQKYRRRNGKSKYCSDACKKEAARRKQAAWRKAHPGYLKEWRARTKDPYQAES